MSYHITLEKKYFQSTVLSWKKVMQRCPQWFAYWNVVVFEIGEPHRYHRTTFVSFRMTRSLVEERDTGLLGGSRLAYSCSLGGIAFFVHINWTRTVFANPAKQIRHSRPPTTHLSLCIAQRARLTDWIDSNLPRDPRKKPRQRVPCIWGIHVHWGARCSRQLVAEVQSRHALWSHQMLGRRSCLF